MMRFEFDDRGYVSCILYGCTTGNCIEYDGLVPNEPEEYADMDDWADRAKTQAYYLDDKGNLAYDSARAESLCPEDEVVLQKYTHDQMKALGILDAIYPIGSIYISTDPTSPAELFGGTWERIEDRFLLAAGKTEAGETGGAESQAFAAKHNHIAPIGATSLAVGAVNVNGMVNVGAGKAYFTSNLAYSGTLQQNVAGFYTTDAVVSAAISTMPPYLTVYVWKRVKDPENYENLYDDSDRQLYDVAERELKVTDKYFLSYTGEKIEEALDAAMNAMSKSGGTMAGALILSGNPTENMEAATKQYVDSKGLPDVSEEDNGKVMMVVDGAWAAVPLPKYEGEYSVTPSTEEYTLLTSQKFVDANIVVEKIPYSEVSNPANGITATIG